MSNHTEGPWQVHDLGDSGLERPDEWRSLRIDGPTGICVAVANATAAPSYEQRGTVLANARLMASAPDLLAACEFAVQWLSGEDAEIVQRAINKARGK